MIFDYYKGGLIHRLDPRVRVLWVLLITAMSLITLDPWLLAIPTALVLAVILLSRPHRLSLFRDRLLMSILLMLLATMFFSNLLLANVRGTTPVVIFGVRLPFSRERLALATATTLRLAASVLSLMFLIFTTSPREFMFALERFGAPRQLTLMFALALRYMPTLYEDFFRIAAAMKARGHVGLEEGGVLRRLAAYKDVLLALIVNSLALVRRLAVMLELRGYTFETTRTYMDEYGFGKLDYAFLAALLLAFAIMLLLRFTGVG